jgi:hypothetical protein
MAKLNEKRKKKKKKAMLVFMLYTSSWLTCTHIIWEIKRTSGFGVLLKKITKNRRF